MRTRECPEPWVVSRAVSQGMDAAVSEHLLGCAECRELLAQETELRRRAQALPPLVPSRASVQRVREAVLGAGASRPEPRHSSVRWALAAGLVLVVGGATWSWQRHSAAQPGSTLARRPVFEPAPVLSAPAPEATVARRKGTVHARAGARLFELGVPGDEVVRLEEGGVTVEVAKLASTERFRVVTGDGEVEVRGTAFDVDVVHDELRAVRVWHGVVEVRPVHGAQLTLRAGERWTSPPALPTRRPVAVEPTSAPASEIAAPPPLQSPEEDAFNAGWTALRTRNFAQASHAFEEVLRVPDSPLVEDARYWNAVALQSAGKTSEALAAWDELLAAHPGAERAAEANVAAGWLELSRGNLAGARARFEAVGSEASARVRASAQSGRARCAR